ncbi:PilZ domain-containing protein [Desulfosediminicola flagellatus]|uniref:PilZ domain-containing protein n=1 Tax=Desulfosediminicola flagellatus TaxID=2569541 RepID=UPI0010ABBBB8|nr:PilZ domain-containing protein [Desulfosediminicola flagellatus]
MISDIDNLRKIPDSKPVRIFVPLIDKAERYRASCVLQQSTPPKFNLLFKPGVLPAELINTKETCLINIDMGGPNVSLEAKIRNIVSDQSLEMTLVKTINHEQMREFFRVDAKAKVISSSFHPEFYDTPKDPWSIEGKTLDISGSGVLALFNTAPPRDKQVRLSIMLPNKDLEVINVLAHHVRIQQIGDDQYEVAYHFDDISSEDRDKIIGCCLVIQRKLLRLKVQVKN